MKRLILFLIPVLLLVACAPSRYIWQHEAGLGESEFQQAKEFCDRYAAEQTPRHYRIYPYVFGGYPYYYDDYRQNQRHYFPPYSSPGYYPLDYFSDIDLYEYQQDISRACLKGKGWDRIKVEGG